MAVLVRDLAAAVRLVPVRPVPVREAAVRLVPVREPEARLVPVREAEARLVPVGEALVVVVVEVVVVAAALAMLVGGAAVDRPTLEAPPHPAIAVATAHTANSGTPRAVRRQPATAVFVIGARPRINRIRPAGQPWPARPST